MPRVRKSQWGKYSVFHRINTQNQMQLCPCPLAPATWQTADKTPAWPSQCGGTAWWLVPASGPYTPAPSGGSAAAVLVRQSPVKSNHSRKMPFLELVLAQPSGGGVFCLRPWIQCRRIIHLLEMNIHFTWSRKIRARGAQSVVLMKRTTSVTLHSNGLVSKHNFWGGSVFEVYKHAHR